MAWLHHRVARSVSPPATARNVSLPRCAFFPAESGEAARRVRPDAPPGVICMRPRRAQGATAVSSATPVRDRGKAWAVSGGRHEPRPSVLLRCTRCAVAAAGTGKLGAIHDANGGKTLGAHLPHISAFAQ